MGCAESRTEVKEISRMFKNRSMTMPVKEVEPGIMVDQDKSVFAHRQIKTSLSFSENDTSGLKSYAEWCRINNKWKEIAGMVGYGIPITNPNAYIGWAEKPSSIGSLCIVYLCIECRLNPTKISPLLESSLLSLVKAFEYSSRDFQENLMLLFFYFLDTAQSSSIAKLVNYKFIQNSIIYFSSNNMQMRSLTAAVCAKIYKGRLYAQEEFFRCGGEKELIGLIRHSKDEDDETLAGLIDDCIYLLQDEEGKPVKSNINRMHETDIWEVLYSFNRTEVTAELTERIEMMISILSFV